jgi:hypothetical protein
VAAQARRTAVAHRYQLSADSQKQGHETATFFLAESDLFREGEAPAEPLVSGSAEASPSRKRVGTSVACSEGRL